MQDDLIEVTSRGGRGFGGPPGFLGGAPRMTSRDPIYVPVTIRDDRKSWAHVGMRYKGNSSLAAFRRSTTRKLPFRLDFDRFEEQFPDIRKQKFHGFRSLTFASNDRDESQLREMLASELLRDRGVAAARAALYRVYVDTGDGEQYWGLYTLVEDPADDAFLDSQFGNHDGNLYKPEGPGANWTQFTPAGFGKKNHKTRGDYSDVQGAVAALNAPRANVIAWRKSLEARFDVDAFLRWLAVNTLMNNWDAYGRMAHNYYLYADQARRGRLVWIPWDHNEAFSLGGVGEWGRGDADVFHRDAGAQWPLLSVLLQDPDYNTRYRRALRYAMEGLGDPAAFATRATFLHKLIATAVEPTADSPRSGRQPSQLTFESSVDGEFGLVALLRDREADIRAELSGAPKQPQQ
jgi:spore coat protein CotH